MTVAEHPGTATAPNLAALDRALQAAIRDDGGAAPPEDGLFSNIAGRPVSLKRAADDLLAYSRQPATLADITLPVPAEVADIVAALRRHGVVILPGILQGAALQALSDDFAATIRDHARLADRFEVSTAEHTVCVRLDRRKLAGDFLPAIQAFYGHPLLEAVSARFYGHDDFILNRQIFVQETRPTDAPFSGELHFDVSRMLKFWVYLEPGTREAGAIRIAPGSHLWIRKLREEFSERLIPKAQIGNEVDEAGHPALPIETPAGSLVIFETDAAHGAGHVAPGHVRRILRGHTIDAKLMDRAKKRKAK